MSSNWVSNLDMLAAGGVIDFDAAAYLLDQPARYVGNPQIEGLPLENPSLLPQGVKLKDVPQIDEYSGSNKKPSASTSWKKWTFGGLVTTLIGAGAFALFKGKIPFLGKIASGASKITSSAKGLGATALNYIKKPFTWIASKIKKP